MAIEDSHAGIESAKTAGLACIGITHTYAAPELHLADAIVASLDEITPEMIRSIGSGTLKVRVQVPEPSRSE